MAAVPLIAAGASVLGSVLSGIFGSSSQRSANQTNLEIARETNAQNKELFNQQLAWAEDMWNKTNEWNSPKNQMDMLRKAGINPALGSEWQTTSQPGTPSAPQMQGATMNPVDYSWIGNSVTTGVNAYYNNSLTNEITRKTSAEAAQAKVKAELDTHALKYNLMKIMNDADASGYAKEQAKIQLDILNRTQEYSVRQAEWQTKIMEQEYEKAVNDIAESQLRQEAQRIANQYAPQLAEAQLKQFHANVAAAYAAAKASDASAMLSAANAAVADLQGEGIKIDNRQKRMIASSIISEAQERAKQAKETTLQLQSRNMYGEARQRLIGSYPVKIEPGSVGGSGSRVLNAYQRGVKRGLEKKAKKVSSW